MVKAGTKVVAVKIVRSNETLNTFCNGPKVGCHQAEKNLGPERLCVTKNRWPVTARAGMRSQVF